MTPLRARLCRVAVPVVAAATLVQVGPALAATATRPPTKAKISAAMIRYSVRTLTVAPGARVTFSNDESAFYSAPHTLTSDKRGLFSTGTVSPGGSRTFTAPRTVGTYRFHCQIHSSMHGTLIVKK